MSTLISKIDKNLIVKIAKVILIIISIPVISFLLNNAILALYNIGRYAGTFLRNTFILVQSL